MAELVGDRKLPRITVLMPCRNGRDFIAQVIASIQRQRYPNLEHIVLDACSTDGTLCLLRAYPEVVVASEPDRSAHEAMNKGLARASGEIIGFLGVDDLYPDGALIDVGRAFAANPQVDVVVGHVIVFEDGASERRLVAEYIRPDRLGLPDLMFGVSGFYGVFFRRRVFDLVGQFEESFEFTADLHFLLRVMVAGLTVARVDRPTILYRMHPGSRTINPKMTNRLAMARERFRMAIELAETPKLRATDRRLFHAWHAFEGVKLIKLALARGQITEALSVSVEMSKRNPTWPLRLINALALRRSVTAGRRSVATSLATTGSAVPEHP